MTQDLNGVDIYHCPYFEVDSSGKLKFIKGKFYDRTPDSFKSINEIYEVERYCMWIIKQEEHSDITIYATVVYLNRVKDRLLKIEKELRKMLKKRQLKEEAVLNKSINKTRRLKQRIINEIEGLKNDN